MKRFFKFFLFLTVTSSLFVGCSIYRPQAIDLPLHENRGDLRVSIGSGNLSAAYAITDNIGAQAYVKTLLDSMSVIQLSAGWYHPFDNGTVAEVFGGFGHTSGVTSTIADSVGMANQNGYVTSFFVQGDYGFVHRGFKGNMDLGVTVKTGLLTYNVTENITDDLDGSVISGNTTYSGSSFFLEPGVMWRFGWEHFKFHLAFSMGIAPGVEFHYFPWKVSAGISLDFNLARH